MARQNTFTMLFAWLGLAWFFVGAVQSSPISLNTTSADLAAAKKVVADAIAEASKLNKARLDNPSRNHYTLAPQTSTASRRRGSGSSVLSDLDQVLPPPLLDITPEIANAAALVAEAEAIGAISSSNSSLLGSETSSTPQLLHKRDGFWMETISRKGTSPWGNDASYKVYRNVKDYGAKGDGVTDDTAAINKAISDGNRCGKNCSGSTTKNAIVYLPAGTYLVSSPLIIYFGTQFIGDATNWPKIKAAGSFVGLGVLTTDVYVGDGAGADGKDNEWYVNTASFYRQIRNMRIDITGTDPNAYVAAVHYQVAQATSIQYVEFIATTGTTQQGIYAENGSGGVMADLTFTGGAFGIYGGNQQFTAQRLTFNGCATAVQTIWDWGWVWKTITVNNGNVGFRLVPEGDSGNVGSAAFLDSIFNNVKQAIIIAPPSETPGSGSTGIVLDNVNFKSVDVGVGDTNGNTLLSGAEGVSSWVMGPVYNDTVRTWTAGESRDQLRDLTLTGPLVDGMANIPYYERAKPQYETKSAGDFVHLKDLGAKGDGSTDDTAALQSALNGNIGKIIFADAGVYMLSDTVTVPAGTVIVGEAWTQFAATGSKFSDPKNPNVMLRVGNEGDKGSVELQDLIFTTKGPTPGAVLIEWNILADEPGAAALWDCHARLGGATGTELTPDECPALTNGQVNSDCQTAALVMHLTNGASGYFDNMWLWTSDHMLDDPDLNNGKNDLTQLSVFTARGFLIESQEPTWLYGTSSEHAVFYQYNFNSAKHVFAGFLQTETPYYQPSPTAPNPYKDDVGIFPDPDYSCAGGEYDGCDSAWGVVITESQDIYITSAGIYSFFDTYTQDCIDQHTCQNALVLLQDNYAQVRILQLITIGAKYSVVSDGVGILATDNLAISSHPAWSQISMIDAHSGGYAPPFDPTPVYSCNATGHYNSLNDMLADIANIPEQCVSAYALPNLYTMLHTALMNYTKLTADGSYDDKFDAYVRWVKDELPMTLDTFMDPTKPGPGNQYFSCDLDMNGKVTTTNPCKPDVAYVDPTTNPIYTITYTLQDHDGFFADLLNNYGITEDWVKFSEKVDQRHCGTRGCPNVNRHFENYPMPSDNVTVSNPKDILSAGFDGFTTLQDTLLGYYFQMLTGTYTGYSNDVMETLVMPASLAVQASEAMGQVVIIGEEEEEAEKKSLIITIFSAILFALPVVGEGLGVATSTILNTIGRLISLVGAVGDASLSAYSIYEDPKNAPLAILGILSDGAGTLGRTPEQMSELGSLRRGMTADDIPKLGTTFKENDDIIQQMAKFCRAK